jgi:molybdate transport system substrate-binding protein
VEYLADNGLLHEAPVVIAGNELVCIVPRNSTLTFASLQELAAAPPSLIAIADDGVPAGEYARQALKNAGYLNTLKPRLVGQKDARAVVTAVQTGNAAAGFVYLTDARLFADTVGVAFTVDRALHDPIAYYAALLSNSKNARAFFLFLQSQQARAELAKLGF